MLYDENIEQDLGVGVIYFDDGYKVHHVLGVAFIYFLAVLLFLCCYRRNAKREMKRTMDV